MIVLSTVPETPMVVHNNDDSSPKISFKSKRTGAKSPVRPGSIGGKRSGDSQGRQREAKALMNYIQERTGCTSAEEFIDRFKNAFKLAENLRSHQILSDSKLAQLRTEHSELAGKSEEQHFIEWF